MITSSNTMALNNHCATALGPRLGLGLRLTSQSPPAGVGPFSALFVLQLDGKQRNDEEWASALMVMRQAPSWPVSPLLCSSSLALYVSFHSHSRK